MLTQARLVDLLEEVAEHQRFHVRCVRNLGNVLVVAADETITIGWLCPAEVVIHVYEHVAAAREFDERRRHTAAITGITDRTFSAVDPIRVALEIRLNM